MRCGTPDRGPILGRVRVGVLGAAQAFLGDAPVMFISGYAESDFSDLLQDEAGVSFLPKPLDIKTLAERVKQELRGG